MSFESQLHIEYLNRCLREGQAYWKADESHDPQFEPAALNGVYWMLSGIALLKSSINKDLCYGLKKFVSECHVSEEGGFACYPGLRPTAISTVSGILATYLLADLFPHSADDTDTHDKRSIGVRQYIERLRAVSHNSGRMSFLNYISSSRSRSEVDTRFAFCTVAAAYLTKNFNCIESDREGLIDWILDCNNFDGGFGCVPGCESHAGQTYCCMAALELLNGRECLDIHAKHRLKV